MMERLDVRISADILLRLILAAAVPVLTAGAAAACAICLSGFVVTLGQKLDSADQAVLALPLAETAQFRIIDVIKGKAAIDGIITEPNLSEGLGEAGMLMTLDGPANAPKEQRSPGDRPLLLLWNRLAEQWTSVGTIAADHADWLRRLAATKHAGDSGAERSRPLPLAALPSADLTEEEWLERVALAAPYLESPEPVAAEIAYGEIARAPYRALRVLKG